MHYSCQWGGFFKEECPFCTFYRYVSLKHALIRAFGSSFIGLGLPPSPVRTIARYVHRYGLAADALIATGGLVAAARDGDGGEARRMLTLSKESLNDILTIGVNNNLNKTDP